MDEEILLTDQHIKEYRTIDGKQVPVIKCPTKITYRNKVTGEIYESAAEANADVANPNTPTKQEHIAQDLAITVANLSLFGKTK
jgi:hypothetical protein